MNELKKVVILTGRVLVEPGPLPLNVLLSMKAGDIIIKGKWPHVVVDCGAKQGMRIAAFRPPVTWEVK